MATIWRATVRFFLKRSSLSLVAAACLAAGIGLMPGCGGSTTPDSITVLEGLWHGNRSSATLMATSILHDGQFWLVYGTANPTSTAASSPTGANAWVGFSNVEGFVQGTGSVSNMRFNSIDALDFHGTLTITPVAVTAPYVAGKSLNGSITSSSGTAAFTSAPAPTAAYQYNISAKLADVVGTWTGAVVPGTTATATATATATIDAASGLKVTNGTCILSGSINPRAPGITGENVFDIALLAGSACKDAAVQYRGIGLLQAMNNAKAQLIVLSKNSSNDKSLVFFASR